MMPNPVRIFHISASDNLADICRSGGLLSKHAGASLGTAYQNIAHTGAQSSPLSSLAPFKRVLRLGLSRGRRTSKRKPCEA